jgi:hypothetical protein
MQRQTSGHRRLPLATRNPEKGCSVESIAVLVTAVELVEEILLKRLGDKRRAGRGAFTVPQISSKKVPDGGTSGVLEVQVR